MRFGKTFVTIIIFITLMTLAGCGYDTEYVEVVNVWPAEGEEFDTIKEEEISDGDKSSVIVGMVTDVGGIDDESFNQSAWEGLQSLSSVNGIKTIYRESDSPEDFKENFQSIKDEGSELCWGIGFACADVLLEEAKNNPGVHYAIVDSSYENTPENVTGLVFRAQEPSFAVGFVAASVTRSSKIGFVGGVKGEIIDQFQYGYQAGVKYASTLYGKNVEVVVEYADSFADADKGYEIASNMYDQGCDVVYHAAGGTGTGVIEAAKDHNHYVIGVDRDQAYLAPKNVLTSALKKVDVAVELVSKSYLGGEDIGGKTLSFGMTEGAVGISEDHSNYRDEIYDAALLVEDKIKSGEIVPPKSESEYKDFIMSMKEF
ncbi:MAG: BMP family ABC transporter substrate-binding protein [Lachnospiraceae bacterium]|nr:BMP family ABC transporter substrate-binding protein [Lachnospiraceae bacterium]